MIKLALIESTIKLLVNCLLTGGDQFIVLPEENSNIQK